MSEERHHVWAIHDAIRGVVDWAVIQRMCGSAYVPRTRTTINVPYFCRRTTDNTG